MTSETTSPRSSPYSFLTGLPVGSPVSESPNDHALRPRGTSNPSTPPMVSPAAASSSNTVILPSRMSSKSKPPAMAHGAIQSPPNSPPSASPIGGVPVPPFNGIPPSASGRLRKASVSSISSKPDAPFVLHSHHTSASDPSRRLSIEIISHPDFAPYPESSSEVGTGKIVSLNIGGRRFTTTAGTLLARGPNFFSGLLSGHYMASVDETGAFFLDRNGDYFVSILDFLRTGKLRCPPDLSIDGLLEEVHFYSIQLLIDSLSQIVRPIPRITFEDVAGYSQIKAELKSIIDEVRDSLSADSIYTQLFVSPAKCLLFYGPLGCGKSQLAAAFANYCRAELVQLDPQDPHFVSRLEILTQVSDWTIVFFREFDAILSHPTLSKTVVSFVDRIQDNPHIFVIARSCRPAGLWESPLMTPGRIDQRIYVPLPDDSGRREILEVLLNSVPLSSSEVIPSMAASTHGYSPADLKRLCQVMCRIALREYLDEQGVSGAQQAPPVQIRVNEHHMKRASQVVRRSEIERDTRTLPSVGN